jgi:hypothetical protein
MTTLDIPGLRALSQRWIDLGSCCDEPMECPDKAAFDLATAVPALLDRVEELEAEAISVGMRASNIITAKHHEIERLKSLLAEVCELADTAARFLTPLYRKEFYRRDGARIAAIKQEAGL